MAASSGAGGWRHRWRGEVRWAFLLVPVLGAMSLIALMPTAVVIGAVAWLVLGLVAAGLVALGVRRVAGWPAEDRRAAVHATGVALVPAAALAVVVTVLATAVALLLLAPERTDLLVQLWRVPFDRSTWPPTMVAFGALVWSTRPVTSRAARTWAGRKGFTQAVPGWCRHELRRLRTWRVVPAVFGLALGGAPAALVNLALQVEWLPLSAAAERFLAAASWRPLDALTLALVGYTLGVALAEATRRRPASEPAAGASLDVRRPASYLTPFARWLPLALAGVSVAAVLVVAVRFGPDRPWMALFAVGVAAAVEVVQRRLIRRPQRLSQAKERLLDDAFRSSAAHGLAGGAGALLLVMALGAVQAAAVGPRPAPGAMRGVLEVLLGVGAVVGVWSLWFGYGSSHRGRQPTRMAEHTDGQASA